MKKSLLLNTPLIHYPMKNNPVDIFFEEVSVKAWKQKVQYLLAGEDFETKLIRKTSDSIGILPYYSSKDCKRKAVTLKNTTTKTAVYIDEINETEANLKAKKAVNTGANMLFFSLHHPLVDLQKLLDGISCVVYLQCFFLDVHFIKKIEDFQKVQLLIDPLGKLTRTGEWFTDRSLDLNSCKRLLHHPNTTLCINLSNFQNAGASVSQQLAYSISQLAWYCETFPEINHINYIVSCNTDVLVETAKLKSLKTLHETYCNDLGKVIDYTIIQQKSSFNLRAFPSSLNLKLESIEHLIGFSSSVDIICSMPDHNTFFDEDTHFPLISLENLLSISKKTPLRFEGALAFEKVSLQLVEKSIALFNEISKDRNYIDLLEKGIIQRKIQENFHKIAENFKLSHEIHIEHKIAKTYPFSKPSKKFTTIKSLLPKKESELLEQPIWEQTYSNS